MHPERVEVMIKFILALLTVMVSIQTPAFSDTGSVWIENKTDKCIGIRLKTQKDYHTGHILPGAHNVYMMDNWIFAKPVLYVDVFQKGCGNSPVIVTRYDNVGHNAASHLSVKKAANGSYIMVHGD
jgi:hypothetical protein